MTQRHTLCIVPPEFYGNFSQNADREQSCDSFLGLFASFEIFEIFENFEIFERLLGN